MTVLSHPRHTLAPVTHAKPLYVGILGARFWEKVDLLNGPVHPTLGRCWIWTAGLNDGYGRFRLNGRSVGAHRAAYEEENGPVEAELDLDHLCRVRACVRPSHLEPVTRGENVRRGERGRPRGDRCKRGHLLSPWAGKRRQCSPCAVERATEWNRVNRRRAS